MLIENNLHDLLKSFIELTIESKIEKLDIEIINIQHTGPLHYNCQELIHCFLPKLCEAFPSVVILITQEQNVSYETKLEALLKLENPSFICLQLILEEEKKASLKLQPSKNKKFMQGSLILGTLNDITRDFVAFIEKNHGYTVLGN